MAEVDAALKPRIERAVADAKDAGRMEPIEACTADVVRDLLLGAGSPGGVGPVSVSALRSLLSDAFLTVVIRDGVDTLNVRNTPRRRGCRDGLEARGPDRRGGPVLTDACGVAAGGAGGI